MAHREDDVELLYRYRLLMGRCEAGAGLELDDIDTVTRIEAELRQRWIPSSRVNKLHGDSEDGCAADTSAADVELRTWDIEIFGEHVQDPVTLEQLGARECVCDHAPHVARGELIELRIDDWHSDLSYRFMTRVAWVQKSDEHGYQLGLTPIGIPVLLRYSTPSLNREPASTGTSGSDTYLAA